MVSIADRDRRISEIDALLGQKSEQHEQLGREIASLNSERTQLVDANALDNARALTASLEARLSGRGQVPAAAGNQTRRGRFGIRRR